MRTLRRLRLASGDSVGSLAAAINVSDDLPNSPHLNVDDALELLAVDPLLASSLAKTTLGAGESCVACFEWQLSYPRADALCHRPAMTRCRVEILRHLVLRAFG
jgi:hypothetical protein